MQIIYSNEHSSRFEQDTLKMYNKTKLNKIQVEKRQLIFFNDSLFKNLIGRFLIINIEK